MSVSKPLTATQLLVAKKRAVFRFIGIQIAISVAVSLVFLLWSGAIESYSFVLGATACILPNIYMAWRVFGHAGTRPAKEVVRSFYRGEAGKLIMTAVILSLVFLLAKPLAHGALFAGFGLAILSHWLSPLVLKQ
ncbi:ATP synthase subunit I [Marinomonas mediterranea]|uniref:ATP synthase subunit I n=1 Tax=Marinomonas mediterranea TaxID=119864 RepID=UPI002348F21C|nr:ATP synthase subunit I [Marinomonas mediterranea]WCN11306.1 F0F1 ATP synthase assembly protein I [Marinomonas mediterranea]WCN15371.1 F0F1 ATP synthase assembly protein I [Marinomonas mediterranea]